MLLKAESRFVLPFISDINGQSPLQNSLHGDSLANPRVVEYFLKELLPQMPLDHHGRAIVDAIPEMIDRNIPGIGQYMDSRFITTKQLRKVSRLDKMAIMTDKETEDEQYYVTSCDLWPDERLLISRIF